jgi:hypothetical protein
MEKMQHHLSDEALAKAREVGRTLLGLRADVAWACSALSSGRPDAA